MSAYFFETRKELIFPESKFNAVEEVRAFSRAASIPLMSRVTHMSVPRHTHTHT